MRDGNTHYPAPISEFRYFRGELNIPTRIILIDGSGNITLDALDWMAEQGVHLVRLNWDGTNSIISNPTGYSANHDKVAWQLATKSNAAERLKFASKLIERKIKATAVILKESFSPSRSQQLALGKCENALRIFVKNPPGDISRLLGLEGEVAGSYFYVWRECPLTWKSLNQYPVPDDWHKYRSRSALRKAHMNERATHPINAMLNYAYKALETEIRIQCIIDGYDPTIGILHHRNDPQRASNPDFALDLMEPLRPDADRTVIRLIRTEKFAARDFNIQPDGVCRLHPQLARLIISAIPPSMQKTHA